MYVIESTLGINLIFFPFGKISIKYEILKLVFMQCLKSNMGSTECIPSYFHIKWGGWMAKELISILGVSGSDFTSDIIVVNDVMLPICTLHR